jgi:hypothetical protein
LPTRTQQKDENSLFYLTKKARGLTSKEDRSKNFFFKL